MQCHHPFVYLCRLIVTTHLFTYVVSLSPPICLLMSSHCHHPFVYLCRLIVTTQLFTYVVSLSPPICLLMSSHCESKWWFVPLFCALSNRKYPNLLNEFWQRPLQTHYNDTTEMFQAISESTKPQMAKVYIIHVTELNYFWLIIHLYTCTSVLLSGYVRVYCRLLWLELVSFAPGVTWKNMIKDANPDVMVFTYMYRFSRFCFVYQFVRKPSWNKRTTFINDGDEMKWTQTAVSRRL